MAEIGRDGSVAPVSAIVANLACGALHSASTARSATEWVALAADEAIDVLLLQEVPAALVDVLEPRYDTFTYDGGKPAYRCRSLVAVRRARSLRPRPLHLATADYHRSYLAACSLELPGFGRTSVLSVHASPAPLDTRYRVDWRLPLPEPRRDVPTATLWDSDLVLATLESVVTSHGSLLAAGDYNEARASDGWFGGPWGEQYFERANAAALVDVTFARWREERPTRTPRPGRPSWQLDHVLATADVADRVVSVDVLLTGVLAADASDHHPIRFEFA